MRVFMQSTVISQLPQLVENSKAAQGALNLRYTMNR